MKISLKICGAGILALLTWQLILSNFVVKSTGFVSDGILGRIYKPGVYLQGTEGFSKTKINSLGMRGEEISLKMPGEIRIVAFGDSYTEAFQVADNQAYTNILQSNLRSEKYLVTVFNAGRSAASPAEYIHLSNFATRTLGSDFVIVQINDGDFRDDMLNKNGNFFVQEYGQAKFKTIMNKDFSSKNIIAQKFPQLIGLLEYSVFRIGAEHVQKLLEDSSPSVEASRKTDAPPNEALIEWTLTEMKKVLPNVVVVYLPNINYKKIHEQPSKIELLINKYAKLHNVPLIDMREDFIHYYEENKQPAHGFDNTIPGTGHINAIGHRLIADSLKEHFESRLRT